MTTSYPSLFSLSPLSLYVSLPLFPLHTRVRTFTRTHNGRSKFFQGISWLINRLVAWGSSEVQRSRLNPLTGGDNQWQVGPHFSCLPLTHPSPLDLTCGKIRTNLLRPPLAPLYGLPVPLTPVNAPVRGEASNGARGRDFERVREEATIG